MSKIGISLKRLMASSGQTQVQLARDIGVSQVTVSRWMNDVDVPSHENWERVKRLAKSFDTILPDLGDALYPEEASVKVLGEVGAGAVIVPFDNGILEEVTVEHGAPTGCYAAIVRGTSQIPVFEDGDLVGFSEEDLSPDQAVGMLCVVYTADERMLLKKVMRGSKPGLYTLTSINDDDMIDVELVWAKSFKFRWARSAWYR